MIIFETLRWKNFLSTGNAFTEINFREHSTTAIIVTGKQIGRAHV